MSKRQDPQIGYFARHRILPNVLCDGDSCIIAGSEALMKEYITKRAVGIFKPSTIKSTSFSEIMKGISFGASYSFDELSYKRFKPLAEKEGLQLLPWNPGEAPSPECIALMKVQMS
jgi:hypothetical protein